MNKKSVFIVVSVLLLLLVGYEIAKHAINDAIDDTNKRGIELYATEIRYSYARSYLNTSGNASINIDDLNVKINVEVKCEEKSIDSYGNVELKGCTVDNYKSKYRYIDGKVERE